MDTAECPVCGQTMAEGNYACLFCYYSGRYFEQVLNSDLRQNVLGRIRALENVTRAEVWHQGSGAFALAIELADGRIMLPGLPVEVFGNKAVMPAIPPLGENWAINVANNQIEGEITLMPDEVDDDGLVQAVKEISDLGAAMA